MKLDPSSKIESCVVDGDTYDVYPWPDDRSWYGFLLAHGTAWITPLPTGDHMPLGVSVSRHARGLLVTVDGEHYKGGTIQTFTWILAPTGEILEGER